MSNHSSQFKRGATSIYVVIVVMLLLTVVTASFIRIIISEASKTTGDDLAQSAYDSALAGVEDAKLALKKYYDCNVDAETAEGEECSAVIAAFNTGLGAADVTDPTSPRYGYCDVVGEALGRISSTDSVKEVLIKENNTSRNANSHVTQAYTCIMIDNTLGDYRSVLNSSTPFRIIPLKTADPSSITGLRISWYSGEDGDFRTLSFGNKDYFKPYGQPLSTPPTISAQLIQSAPSFSLSQFESNSDNTTNSGTVFLVPTDNDSATTHLQSSVLVNSHDHSSLNAPQKVYCNKNTADEFACSVSISLPKPVGSDSRNKDTFYLILNLPYDQPQTTFSVQLCKDTGGTCQGENAVADFIDAQIAIDATGRANDMYSRIEARVEFTDLFYPYPRYAAEGTGSDERSINKNFYVTSDCLRFNTDGTIYRDASNVSCQNTGDEPDSL